MTRPLVTVVTATWGRPRTIFEHAIPSVAAQTYPEIEHLIVTDGRDAELETVLAVRGFTPFGRKLRLVSLGRNWTGFSGDGAVGAVPRLVGAFMAAGEYICYLDDDNDYLPGHVEAMVDEAESSGADLICTAFRYGADGAPVGCAPPRAGQVDTSSFLHRASLLKRGTWQMDGYEGDGKLIERWIAAGASWRFLPQPTMILNGHRKGEPDAVTEPWPGDGS